MVSDFGKGDTHIFVSLLRRTSCDSRLCFVRENGSEVYRMSLSVTADESFLQVFVGGPY